MYTNIEHFSEFIFCVKCLTLFLCALQKPVKLMELLLFIGIKTHPVALTIHYSYRKANEN